MRRADTPKLHRSWPLNLHLAVAGPAFSGHMVHAWFIRLFRESERRLSLGSNAAAFPVSFGPKSPIGQIRCLWNVLPRKCDPVELHCNMGVSRVFRSRARSPRGAKS